MNSPLFLRGNLVVWALEAAAAEANLVISLLTPRPTHWLPRLWPLVKAAPVIPQHPIFI